MGWVVRVGWAVVGAMGEVSTAAAHASGRPPSVFLASPPSKTCAMRSPDHRKLRAFAASVSEGKKKKTAALEKLR